MGSGCIRGPESLEQTSVARDRVLQNSPQSATPSRKKMDHILGAHYLRKSEKKAIFISDNTEFTAKKHLTSLKGEKGYPILVNCRN